MNPMEMHDMATIPDRTGRVAGGQEFEDKHNRCILSPEMDDSLADLHWSAGSPKPKAWKRAHVSDTVKLEIQGAHVVNLELILMPITKEMLSRLKIWLMVHICSRSHGVKNSAPLNLYDVD